MKISINGKMITALEGQNLLDVIKENQIKIPSPCHHSDQQKKLICQLCVVEIEGQKKLQTACSKKAENGMVIWTDSARIDQTRKKNLHALFTQHYNKEVCDDCIWDSGCELHSLAQKYQINL